MKKALILGLFGMMALASCKKDWTCECTISGNGTSASASGTIHDTKKNATAECDEGDSSAGGYTTECEIK